MKKILIFTAIVLGALSCSKEDVTPVEEQQHQPLVFTAVIDNPVDTKTSIDAASGKVSWVLNDEITITDASSNKAIYSVTAIDSDGKATFTYKTGSSLSSIGSYSAKYGNVNDQWYNGNNGADCPMSSDEISDPSTEVFHFSNECGVFNISATATDIAKIIVSNGGNNYALNFTTAVSSMVAGTDYYMIAVPEGFSCNKISFVKADGSKYTKNLSDAKTVDKGHLKKLKFTGTDFGTESKYTEFEPLALPGVFTVNSSGKKVLFAKGLVYNVSSVTKYSNDQLEHFNKPTFSGGVSSAITTDGAFFHKSHIPTNPVGWYSLSQDEFDYLLTKRIVDSKIIGIDIDSKGEPEKEYSNVRTSSAVVLDKDGNKQYGVFIYPDYFRFPQSIADKITEWEKTNKSISSVKRFYKYINYSTAGNNWSDKYVFEYNDFKLLESSGVVFLNGLGRYYNGSRYNENTVLILYSDINNSIQFTNAVISSSATNNYLTNIRLVTSAN